jgi:hypothetical protein
MAKIVYIIGTLRGSIGGNTFQGNTSGNIVRQRPQVHRSSTNKQTSAHSNLQYWLSEWQALSGTDKADWNTFASVTPKTDKFGEVKTLTGANWFMSVNNMRVLQGLSILTSPPTYSIPPSSPTFDISIASNLLYVNYTSSFNYTDNSLLLWCSLPTTRMKPTINQLRKYLLINTTDPGSPQDITSAWETATGLIFSNVNATPNNQIFISTVPVTKAGGITGAFLSHLVTT